MELENKRKPGRPYANQLVTSGDVCAALKTTYNELRGKKINESHARARGYILNIMLEAYKESETDKRITAIEESIKKIRELREQQSKMRIA